MHTSIHKCYTPCVYYHEVHSKLDKPSVRILCDYKEGIEIRKIPIEEINNCQHFKTFNQIKENNKKYFQITY